MCQRGEGGLGSRSQPMGVPSLADLAFGLPFSAPFPFFWLQSFFFVSPPSSSNFIINYETFISAKTHIIPNPSPIGESWLESD
jgi:hypothetical protein